MKVLIVEDSKAISNMVAQMLNQNSMDTEIAENGQVALDLIDKGSQFDLILLDWNMPVMDGEQFLQAVQGKNVGPIVMMTTENKIEKIQKALGLGASEYIMKPFTIEILLEKINIVKAA